MRYFTRGWANGDMSEVESERVREAYWKGLRELMPKLPPAMAKLAKVNLHDAVIEQVRWNAKTKLLHIRLAAGNQGEGYATVDLRYKGAMLGEIRVETLRDAARDREAFILNDELDMDEEGNLIHRLLFWPREEVSLDFRELEIQVTPRTDRRVLLGGYFVAEEE